MTREPAWNPDVAYVVVPAKGRGSGTRIVGASAGDCGAWLINDSLQNLTERQVSKPLVGSGSSVPVGFEAELGNGTLLLASDGLLKCVRPDRIAALVRDADLQAVPQQLAQLRLRSGELPDDLAIIV